MRKFRFVVFFLVFAAVLSCFPCQINADINLNNRLYSKSCALMDGDSGRVLYGKEETIPLANASTTKIMTCILALELGDLESIVTASQNASAQPKVHLGMQEGEEFYLKDLLYALMLESYNDSAVAIAEHIAGSTEAFAGLMNEKVASLGCEDTHFITPNGLDATDENGMHHTTAEDLCRIMKYCAWDSPKAETFLAITECRSYDFSDLDGRSFRCTNKNSFLDMMDGAITGKTGFTATAGYCYVAAYEKDGKKFCISLLACGWPNNKAYKWSDAKNLFTYGIENYEKKKIKVTRELNNILVKDGMKEKSLQFWKQDFYIEPEVEFEKYCFEYLLSEEDRVTVEVKQETILYAPVKKGQKLGTILVKLNEEILLEIPITNKEEIPKWSLFGLGKCIFEAYQL